MSTWYRKVQQDLGELVNCISAYEEQLEKARVECGMKGNLERLSREMPGIVEHRFNQLQEIEAILEFLNIELRKKRSHVFRQYTEHYNKMLSSRDAEKYVDGEDEIADFQHLVNEFALLRNRFHGLIKALDAKQFQINNIVKQSYLTANLVRFKTTLHFSLVDLQDTVSILQLCSDYECLRSLDSLSGVADGFLMSVP